MPVERKRLLELALPRLRAERDRIEKEIEEIQAELKGLNKPAKQARPKKRKSGARRVTAQQKKAVSERMKKYWVDRKKAEKQKKKGK